MGGVDIDMNTMKPADLRQYFKCIEDKIKKTEFTPEEQKANKEKTDKIMAKLKAGKKLTSKDMTFLQNTNFDAYIHALRVQQTRKNIVSALKHAKSKAQANLIIARALGSIDERDPDKELLIAAINDIADKFKKSTAYQRLPETDRDAKKKDRVNQFSDEAEDDDEDDEDIEKVSDKKSEDASGVGDDAGAFIVAGEPSGNYQPDAGNASVSMSDAGSTTGVTFDMAG